MSLYEGAVKKPIMTSLSFLAVVIFGLFSLSKLPIDLYPNIETNTIMVYTSYEGASASDIETNLTRPLENILNSVSKLKNITSKSSENMSLITLEFDYGDDVDVITNDVRDKLDMISALLPDEAETPIIFKFSTDMMPVVLLSVQARQSMPALYKILDDEVVNPLARIPGVGTVSISGAPKREIQVYCDPGKLEAYNLSIEQISTIIGAENRNIPGGSFDIGNETYSLRVEGEFKDVSELNYIVVGSSNGVNIFLQDIARVVDTIQERTQETYNNGEKGALITIQKQSGANSVSISRAIMGALPELQAKLPSDVKLGVIADTSDNILNTISSLAETVIYSLIFVILVVFIFLGKVRATIIISITIPLSLIASFIYLAVTGNSINLISLSSLSIAIGMVVDDAIVVLENVSTHIDRGSEPRQAAIHGTNEVAISVIASTLTMLAVFFPLTMVSGITGVMFKQLGWMMCAIMIVSTIAALTLTPMMCSLLLKSENTNSKTFLKLYGPIEKALNRLDIWYADLLTKAVRNKAIVISSCAGVFVVSLLCMGGISAEFFPTQDNARIAIDLELPIGTRKEIAQSLSQEITQKWLSKYKDEIKECSYTVGQADASNTLASIQDNGTHIISFDINLVEPGKRLISLEQICDLMRADLAMYPEFTKYNVIFGGNSADVASQPTADFEVYGYHLEQTDSVAAQLKRKLLQVEGVSEVNISRSQYQPEYQVDFDREKLALHGLNLSSAGNHIRNRINGSLASQYREDGDEYDIKVRYGPEFRTSLEDIENIIIYNHLHQPIRIKELGKVVERFTPPTIERKNRERVNTVTAVISGAALGDVVKKSKALISEMDIPSDVSIGIAGSYEDLEESFKDLSVLAILIIILVYIVMAAQFESLTYPFIIMFSLPFAFSGVILALLLTNSTLSVMSFLGAIMLIGIVVKNGIVLIDYTILCRERGMSVALSVATAGRSRLRPVLMTTATTILGLVPMAISTGQGAEMWRPMAISVIGGLLVSTILTLILIPTLYCVFAGIGLKNQRIKMRHNNDLSDYLKPLD